MIEVISVPRFFILTHWSAAHGGGTVRILLADWLLRRQNRDKDSITFGFRFIDLSMGGSITLARP